MVSARTINPVYRLTQPAWLKVAVLLLAAGVLGLAGYLLDVSERDNETILLAALLFMMTIVFAVGFIKQFSSGIWSPLAADRSALFVLASADGSEFLRLPWQHIEDLKKGMHGLNRRGLIIGIRTLHLEAKEKQLIEDSLSISSEQQGKICISVPTGIVNREQALSELKRLHRN